MAELLFEVELYTEYTTLIIENDIAYEHIISLEGFMVLRTGGRAEDCRRKPSVNKISVRKMYGFRSSLGTRNFK